MKNESGWEPKLHYLLVKPDAVEEKTKGGLYLVPDTIAAKERNTTQGTLVAIGPMGWSEFGDGEPMANVGDKVMYGKHAGRDLVGVDGKKYVLMNCEDILAVMS